MIVRAVSIAAACWFIESLYSEVLLLRVLSVTCAFPTSFQVFQFLNAKCESAFLTKRNPRQINWTVLYRRKHKKGQSVCLICPGLHFSQCKSSSSSSLASVFTCCL